MAVVKLTEDYSVALTRNSVRDAMMYHGEQCIALSMYHVNKDEKTYPRCSVCFDDIYKQPEQLCTHCYGTTFEGGVKEAYRIWSVFSDKTAGETYGQKGVWSADQREIQCEAFPLLLEHDYIVRIRKWGDNFTPVEIEGYYGVQQVIRNSMRTGNRFGQWTWDVVGQKANVSELQNNSIITSFPVLGVSFPAPDYVNSAKPSRVANPDADAQIGKEARQ